MFSTKPGFTTLAMDVQEKSIPDEVEVTFVIAIPAPQALELEPLFVTETLCKKLGNVRFANNLQATNLSDLRNISAEQIQKERIRVDYGHYGFSNYHGFIISV